MPTDNGNLTPEEWAAVTVFARQAKKAIDDLPADSEHDVDLTVRLRGTVKRGADGMSVRTVRPTADDILAGLLAGQKGEEIAELVRQLASDNLALESAEGFYAKAATLLAPFSSSATSTRRGAIRGTVNVDVFGAGSVTIQATASGKTTVNLPEKPKRKLTITAEGD